MKANPVVAELREIEALAQKIIAERDRLREELKLAREGLEQIATADHPEYPHFRSGTEMAFSDHLMQVARAALERMKPHTPPYPWCHGSPTTADCAARGYCNRDPNCGE